MKENIRKKIDEQQKSDLTIGVSANELVKNLEDDFAIIGTFEDGCDRLERIVKQMQNLFTEEKQNLNDYELSVAKNRVSLSDIFNHADKLQKLVNATEKEFHALHESLRNKLGLLSEEDAEKYTTEIYTPYDDFIAIIFNIQCVCDEQKYLVK
jgi:hypothetical protein